MTACEISFTQARQYIGLLDPLDVERAVLEDLSGRTTAADIFAVRDSPSAASSLKDGYAVISDDIHQASGDSPVSMKVVGTVLAGDAPSITIKSGEAARIMTGATIPEGATSVLASEFAEEDPSRGVVTAFADARTGKNILERGGEIAGGQCLVKAGELITPAIAGLLAASGISTAPVYRRPSVALVATGSEIVRQSGTLAEGQIFQSNQYVTLAWLHAYGISGKIFLVRDDFARLEEMIRELLQQFDVIVTSGGLLSGDRDLVLPVMEKMGTDYIFKRVKMGPGKGVCLGTCNGRTIFNLPGGPPSNYLAFMLLALPGILSLYGRKDPWRPAFKARLCMDVTGRREWTQFVFSTRQRDPDGMFSVVPCEPGSRLMKIALSDCVIEVPEGMEVLKEGELVTIHDFQFA